MNFKLRTTAIFASLIFACASFAAADEFHAITVFQNGTDGYKVFRIPAIIKAANGDLLAFCEARTGGDASQIDLVSKRSTDDGKTWQKLQVVQDHNDFRSLFPKDAPPITVGNPAPVVDLLDPEHPGRIWLPFTLENDRVFVTSSDDHGKTWTPRREITQDVKLEPWGWYATGPVHSIQLQHGKDRGRLVIPADHRLGDDGADRGAEGAQAILSDDHGKTWRLGAIDDTYEDDLKANETTVIELNDGRLYFNTRDQNGKATGTRGGAYSSDGGESFDAARTAPYKWFSPEPAPFDTPVVQCALFRAASTTAGDTQNLILFSGPDESGPSGKGRSDLRLRYSIDETATWHDGPLIHEGPAAYSDMVGLKPERFGVLFEAGLKGQKSYDRILFVAFGVADLQLPTVVKSGNANPAAPFTIERTVLTRGYDGLKCWVHARAGILPPPDNQSSPDVVVTTQPLMITGSDVFYALNSTFSRDLGKSWSPLMPQATFERQRITERQEETICDFTPAWHGATGKLLGTGQTVRYQDNKVMKVRPRHTAWSVYDPATHQWSQPRNLKMPDEVRFENCGAGSVQRFDLPNGDILLPVYFKEPQKAQYGVTVCRCKFDGNELTYLEHGTELTIDVKRGLYEPSITKSGDRFFLTLRNDDHGYITSSADGLMFDEPRRWTFDDGSDLGNYNTQQHWVTHDEKLYLVYTRKGADNDHVFRHRAPLFIAEVDPDKLHIIQSTEQVLVPERGARLGNFGVAKITSNETWVVVTEWMQTWGPNHVMPVDNKHGADNSIHIAKIQWQ